MGILDTNSVVWKGKNNKKKVPFLRKQRVDAFTDLIFLGLRLWVWVLHLQEGNNSKIHWKSLLPSAFFRSTNAGCEKIFHHSMHLSDRTIAMVSPSKSTFFVLYFSVRLFTTFPKLPSNPCSIEFNFFRNIGGHFKFIGQKLTSAKCPPKDRYTYLHLIE